MDLLEKARLKQNEPKNPLGKKIEIKKILEMNENE